MTTNEINAKLATDRLMPAKNQEDPKEIAAKVQGMFMEIMLKSMEESVDAEDGLFGKSISSDMYRGMLREHIAKAMSEKMDSPLEKVIDRALAERSAAVSPSAGRAHGHSHDNDAKELETLEPIANDLPVNGRITSREGWRRDPINGQSKYHAGTDIAAPAGTAIHAVANGRVIESGVKRGYGNTVVVETEDGRKMLYAHNSKNFVQVGDWVSRGEPIAAVGSTGRSTGPHVHFEVKF
jgi:murein DD-endopeptidase MepM/ murein hydrolase activator NlpD